MTKLSVVIPAYNEAERIGKTLEDVSRYLSRQPYQYEVLVVNDGSKDDTAAVVRKLSGTIPNLKLVDNAGNKGKGGVVRQGMLAASGDVRLFMDADNSTKVEEVAKFLPHFERGADLVIGSRRIEGSVIAVKQPWIRDFLGGVFRTVVHTLVPMRVTDSQCGFKAFSAKAAELVFGKQTVFRWAFDVELLAIARAHKLKIVEVPVTWVNDAASKVKFSGMVNMLLEVLKVRLQLWQGVYR